MVISVAKKKEVVIYRVIAEVAGDPTVGIYDTSVQIGFDDGYVIQDRRDYSYFIDEVEAFIENLYGEKPRLSLYDDDDNRICP